MKSRKDGNTEAAVIWEIGNSGLFYPHVDRRGDPEARKIREAGMAKITQQLRAAGAIIREEQDR